MADSLFDISGKIALVTGGTAGIGTMIARGLVRRGVRTYVTGRDLGSTQQVAAEIAAEGGECIGLAADLADPEAPAQLAETLGRSETRLDILVNNAGVGAAGEISTVTVESWDWMLEVNLRAPFFLVQQLLPLLRAAATPEDPARIVNVGSIGGLHIPGWESFPYGASKAALHHLTRALTKRLGREHIIANAIAPGPFPSRMNNVESEMVKKSIATYIPLNRAGTAEDVEGAIVFLTSRAGSYVNGHTIPLDGGYIAAL